MEVLSFSPKIRLTTDSLGAVFLAGARGLLLVLLVLLPFFCLPGMVSAAPATKAFFVLGMLVPVVILSSLGYLRLGTLTWRFLPVVVSWWGLVLAVLVAGLLAPEPRVAFLGDAVEPQTVGFMVLLGVVLTLVPILCTTKRVIMALFTGLLGVAVVVSLLQLVRIFLPWVPGITTVMPQPASSLVGSFNDVALLATFAVVVALIALLQLRLTRLLQGALAAVVAVLLLAVTVVNFYALWVMLAFLSLLLLLFALTKGRREPAGQAPSLLVIGVVGAVFVLASVAVVGGNAFGSFINGLTEVSYIEVRPSFAATLDVVRQVYADNALFGAGPNHFSEVWTRYKDPSLNVTLFWNTSFFSASGFITTWFVTSGILGVVAWCVFLAAFLWTGFRALFRPARTDELWYFIATISFLGGLFVWGVSLFYVTGVVMLVFGMVATGILVVAESKLTERNAVVLPLLERSSTNIALIVAVMVLVIGAMAAGYYGFRQLSAARLYTQAVATTVTDLTDTTVPMKLSAAYDLSPNALYARDLARYQLAIISRLAQKADPTAEDVAQFQQVMAAAVQAATIAVDTRRSDVRNWQMLSEVYGTLAALGIEGAKEQVYKVLPELTMRDPQNPAYALTEAAILLRDNDESGARTKIATALALKPNYTDALNLLTQLDIAKGNIKDAIATVRSLTVLEPGNPARYYQLGVLYAADNESEAAIEAFTRALTLSPDYANARYMRAVEFAKRGDRDTALAELRLLATSNPDNADLTAAIERVERGETIEAPSASPVTEPTTVSTEGESTTTTTEPDTDLIAPVNTVGTASSTGVGE